MKTFFYDCKKKRRKLAEEKKKHIHQSCPKIKSYGMFPNKTQRTPFFMLKNDGCRFSKEQKCKKKK